jgi:chromosome segregation ATPase
MHKITRLLVTNLPSADDKSLQHKVSELREALQEVQLTASASSQQAQDLWGKVQHSEQNARQLHSHVFNLEQNLQLAMAQLQPGPNGADSLHMLRGHQLSHALEEVHRLNKVLAQATADKEQAQHALAASHQEAERAAGAAKEERDRLSLEVAECRLLTQARSRQMEALKKEAEELRTASAKAESALEAATKAHRELQVNSSPSL